MLKWLGLACMLLSILAEVLSHKATDLEIRAHAATAAQYGYPLGVALLVLAVPMLIAQRRQRKIFHGTMMRWIGIALISAATIMTWRPFGLAQFWDTYLNSLNVARTIGSEHSILHKPELFLPITIFAMTVMGCAAVASANIWWTLLVIPMNLIWIIAPDLVGWVLIAFIGWFAASRAACPRCGHPFGLQLTASTFVGSFTRWNPTTREVKFTATRPGVYENYREVTYQGTAQVQTDEPSQHQIYDQVHHCRGCGLSVERRVET